MELQQDTFPQNTNKITSYQPEKSLIVINGQQYSHSLLLSANQITPWGAPSIDLLSTKDFKLIADKKPEVFLLGTGPQQHFLPIDIIAPCIQANIPVETMDTGAACRTFNLLVADERPVWAALIL